MQGEVCTVQGEVCTVQCLVSSVLWCSTERGKLMEDCGLTNQNRDVFLGTGGFVLYNAYSNYRFYAV